MNKVFLILAFLVVFVSIFVLMGVFWLFFGKVEEITLIRVGVLLFTISIATSFVLGIIGAIFVKEKKTMFKFLVFLGVWGFLLFPIFVGDYSYYSFVMIFGWVGITYFLYDVVADIIVGPFRKGFPKSVMLNVFLSRTTMVLILGIISFLFVMEFKYLFLVALGVIVAFILEDINRFLLLTKNKEFGGYDLIMFNVSKMVSSLKKELDDNVSLVNALKLQIEIFSNAKKEIFSSVELLKKKISDNMSMIEEYEVRYGVLEDELSSLVGNYSTYVLEFEYFLSKLRNAFDEIKDVFSSSCSSITGAITKKEEINKAFSETYPVLDSLFSKIDAVSEIVNNIVLEENKMATNMDLILNELSALTVISTNVEIEAFKTKSSKTMMTVINEISSINNQIRTYVVEMQQVFSKVKDLFEYLKLSSQGILKHSDRVKFNVGLVVEKVNDVVNGVNSQVLKLSGIEKNFEEVDHSVEAIYSQIRKFREFLEKLSESLGLISKIRSMLKEIKVSLNETFVILEEIQQNVSES